MSTKRAALIAAALSAGLLAVSGAALPTAHAAESNRLVSRVGTGGVLGNAFSQTPSVSADGRFIAFHSYATNLVVNDTNNAGDIFVKNLNSGGITLVSRSTGGTLANSASVISPEMSETGRFVVFASAATNLVPGDTATCEDPQDPGGPVHPCFDVFVRDRDTDGDNIFDEGNAVKTVRVSVASDGSQVFGDSGLGGGSVGERAFSISATGRFVVFTSQDDFIGGGFYDGYNGVYLHDRDIDNDGVFDEAGQIETSLVAAPFENDASFVDVSADGQSIVFRTTGQMGSDTNQFTPDVFMYDRPSATHRILDKNDLGVQSNGGAAYPSISDDGRYVAFTSTGTNLVTPNDPNSVSDLFIHDRDRDGDQIFDEPGGFTTRKFSLGIGGALADASTFSSQITRNGRFVAFQSEASNLVAGDTGTSTDVFVVDRLTKKISRRSLDSAGGAPSSGAYEPVTSNDNGVTTFWSSANDIITGDTNGHGDIFARVITGIVKCNGEVATKVGSGNAETITGTNSRDIIAALGGGDTINAGGGADLVCAGGGVDLVNGQGANDTLYGEDGNDLIAGNDGNDRLFGGNGNDAMDGGASTDRCDGGAQTTADSATACETIIGVP